jgi:hypothetical protein
MHKCTYCVLRAQMLFLFPNRFSAAGHLQRERDGPDCGSGGSASAALGGRQVSYLYSGPYRVEQLAGRLTLQELLIP